MIREFEEYDIPKEGLEEKISSETIDMRETALTINDLVT